MKIALVFFLCAIITVCSARFWRPYRRFWQKPTGGGGRSEESTYITNPDKQLEPIERPPPATTPPQRERMSPNGPSWMFHEPSPNMEFMGGIFRRMRRFG
ncbi:hypothetical protein TELCIR_22736 [Teladorsagia circumcincta]|uniref:Uncharacterized protein n=1 Tax=Teladorsagia circumcincta TaxID=45464 RepID=A0A2G9TD48_TELCI|nr:hypothetical protein TELCIR_22736 [Teladorsagia circumcincta]